MRPPRAQDVTVQEDGFTLVSSPKKKTNVKSALFKFINKLQEDELKKHAWNGIVIRPSEERRAFILKLIPQAISIYPEYRVFDRHIRIDETFDETFDEADSKGAQTYLRSHWHYTEKLINAAQEVVKIHVYFNHSFPLAVYVINNQGKKEKIEDPAILKIIYSNCQLARTTVEILLDKLNHYRNKIELNLIELFEQLNDIYYMSKLSQKEIKEKIESCHKLNNLLRECSESHNEDRSLHIETLRKKAFNIKKEAPLEPSKISLTDSPPLLPSTTQKPQKDKQHKTIENTENIAKVKLKILELEKSYKDAKIADFIILEPNRHSLQCDLIILLFDNDLKRMIGNLESLDKRIKKLPTLLSIFTKCVLNAEIDNVKTLFPHIKKQITARFYTELFNHLSNEETQPSKNNTFIEIFDFLYTEDHKCRTFISTLPFIFITFENLPNIECTALFVLALKEKKELFCFFINKLQSAHYPGILIGKDYYSLLNCIAFFDEDSEYTRCLLEVGALPEGFYIDNSSIKISSVEKILQEEGAGSLLLTAKEKSPKEHHSYDEEDIREILNNFLSFIPVKSAYFSYCMNDKINIEVIKALSEKSSDINIVLGCTALVLQSKITMTPSDGDQIFHLCQSIEEKDQILLQSKVAEGKATNLKFILTTKPHVIKALKMAIDIFKNRLAKLDEDGIDNLALQLITLATDTRKLLNYSLALLAYNALLITINNQKPSIESHRRIIQTLKTIKTVHIEDTNSIMSNDKEAFAKLFQALVDIFTKCSLFRDQLIKKTRPVLR